jgi:hypothetical protein
MARVLRLTILLSSIWLTGSAWATTYYIAANGSDSNNGTSTSAPWLHVPGMRGCSANCASKTPAAGDKFILRGGDVWHFSTSNGVQGLPWSLPASNGSASNAIYYGVDHTWYSTSACGASWCRPVLDGDNPITYPPNPLSRSNVAACATGAMANGSMISDNGQWTVIDDLELRGYCWNTNPGYMSHCIISEDQGNGRYSNLYIHGWSHTAVNYGAAAFCGPSNNVPAVIDSSVVDGSDSDATGFAALVYGPPTIINSVFRYHANGVTNGGHILAGNLFEYVAEPYSNGSDYPHGNVMEWNNEQSGTGNYIYNNLIRHNTTAVGLWACPGTGNTDYFFNNVIYADPLETWAYQTSDSVCGGGGVSYFFNNTIQNGVYGKSGASFGSTMNSNFFIDSSVTGTPTSNSNFISTTSVNAGTYGYTMNSNYAATSNDCSGNASASGCPVAKGANLISLCTAIPDASARAACSKDSTAGPNYDPVKHRVTGTFRSPVARPGSGPWDAGAYQAQPAQTLNPPSGLSAVVM